MVPARWRSELTISHRVVDVQPRLAAARQKSTIPCDTKSEVIDLTEVSSCPPPRPGRCLSMLPNAPDACYKPHNGYNAFIPTLHRLNRFTGSVNVEIVDHADTQGCSLEAFQSLELKSLTLNKSQKNETRHISGDLCFNASRLSAALNAKDQANPVHLHHPSMLTSSF